MSDDLDIFDLLDVSTQEIENAKPKTPNEEFIEWFTRGGSASKFEHTCVYVRSVLSFLDFLTEDEGYTIVRKLPGINGEIVKNLDRKGRAKELIKYYIYVIYAQGFHSLYGKGSKKEINIDVCLNILSEKELFKTVTWEGSNKTHI